MDTGTSTIRMKPDDYQQIVQNLCTYLADSKVGSPQIGCAEMGNDVYVTYCESQLDLIPDIVLQMDIFLYSLPPEMYLTKMVGTNYCELNIYS